MEIRHKLWLERNEKTVFGKGREELLRSIDEMHSLYAAAKKLNMSYRAAWGRLKASEARLGLKLTCSDGQGKGMHLTPEAKELLEKFDRLEHDVESFLDDYAGIFSISKTKIRTAVENKNFKDIKVLKLCILAFLVLAEDFNVMTFVDACSTAL
ncbi:MAG: winged helix-turn-helix domain-containing protein [Syntrophales bacterium]